MDLAPDYWGGYYALGTLALRREEYAAAISFLEKARSLARSEHRIYRQLGRAFWRSLDLRAALEQYKKALLLRPHSAEIFAELSETALDAGQTPEEVLALAAEIPGLSANPEYQALLYDNKTAASSDTTWESARQDSLEQDLSSVCELIKKKRAVAVLSSYPDREPPGILRAARSCGSSYANLSLLFRNRYKNRREYVSYDNVHPNSVGYKFMAEEYARIIGEQLRLDDKMNEDFQ